MKTKILLGISLGIMAGIIIYGLIFPESLESMLTQPEFYPHAKFIHIIAVTLFFANAVLGIMWEARSLVSKDPDIIRHTYDTVSWLDARFTSPMIVLSVISGIMLGINLSGMWSMWSIGWFSVSFGFFILSGIIWVAADIPTQYKVNSLFKAVEPGAKTLPDELMRLLWFRMKISFAGTLPLLVVFVFMVYQPEMQSVSDWFSPSVEAPEVQSGQ